jgi:RNA polymerase sigma-70 factor (ECF subfamily)
VSPEQERQAAALMALAQRGDADAYADLLVLVSSAARRFAGARLGPAIWIDDVVQEILLTIHLSRHTYDASRPFAPWFYAIAKSRLIDAVRRHRRVAGHETATEVLPERTADAGADASIDVEAIRAALQALPDRQREVIEAMKYRDESVRDIAARLGLTESAVKVTAHRGYRALKRLLGGGRSEN